jgi:hypothetical protein
MAAPAVQPPPRRLTPQQDALRDNASLIYAALELLREGDAPPL